MVGVVIFPAQIFADEVVVAGFLVGPDEVVPDGAVLREVVLSAPQPPIHVGGQAVHEGGRHQLRLFERHHSHVVASNGWCQAGSKHHFSESF